MLPSQQLHKIVSRLLFFKQPCKSYLVLEDVLVVVDEVSVAFCPDFILEHLLMNAVVGVGVKVSLVFLRGFIRGSRGGQLLSITVRRC